MQLTEYFLVKYMLPAGRNHRDAIPGSDKASTGSRVDSMGVPPGPGTPAQLVAQQPTRIYAEVPG